MKRILWIFTLAAYTAIMAPGCVSAPVPELPAPEIAKQEEPEVPDNPPAPPTTPEWEQNRGKIVTPGSDWSKEVISDGLIWYRFRKKDDISNAAQTVNVVDLDLSKTRYTFKFVCEDERMVTSDVLVKEEAVVAINAAYEKTSIFARVDGVNLFTITSNVIGTTTVPNWKNDGGIFSDGERDVTFVDSDNNFTLNQTRSFYITSSQPNIFTSAPVLLNDFEPVGETFIQRCPGWTSSISLTSLNSEDPIRHQGVRHPRTAVAKTENNHLLLITVDGRQKNVSEGMTAAELTKFLVKHFNPQYALNMDGGGSTTLCIDGRGDEETHVVNIPVDNGPSGQRSLFTFFCVIDNEK